MQPFQSLSLVIMSSEDFCKYETSGVDKEAINKLFQLAVFRQVDTGNTPATYMQRDGETNEVFI